MMLPARKTRRPADGGPIRRVGLVDRRPDDLPQARIAAGFAGGEGAGVIPGAPPVPRRNPRAGPGLATPVRSRGEGSWLPSEPPAGPAAQPGKRGRPGICFPLSPARKPLKLLKRGENKNFRGFSWIFGGKRGRPSIRQSSAHPATVSPDSLRKRGREVVGGPRGCPRCRARLVHSLSPGCAGMVSSLIPRRAQGCPGTDSWDSNGSNSRAPSADPVTLAPAGPRPDAAGLLFYRNFA